jgi:hypothetical protein
MEINKRLLEGIIETTPHPKSVTVTLAMKIRSRSRWQRRVGHGHAGNEDSVTVTLSTKSWSRSRWQRRVGPESRSRYHDDYFGPPYRMIQGNITFTLSKCDVTWRSCIYNDWSSPHRGIGTHKLQTSSGIPLSTTCR